MTPHFVMAGNPLQILLSLLMKWLLSLADSIGSSHNECLIIHRPLSLSVLYFKITLLKYIAYVTDVKRLALLAVVRAK
jgi:hypothetical protein